MFLQIVFDSSRDDYVLICTLKKEVMTNSNASGILIQVINLERRPDRLARISAELQRAELSFETQVAVDGQLEPHEPKFISKGAIGCWKSHVNSMRRIVEARVPFGLILEDDATLSPIVNDKFLSEMVDLMKRNQLDILQLGFIEWPYSLSLKSFAPGALEFLISLMKNIGKRDSSGFRFVLGEFRIGTHAYIVNTRLAEAILEISPGPPLIPWDDYLGQLAQNQMYGEIKIARLVKAVAWQASYQFEGLQIDSDIP
jgi:GR25 family glycosyltransferase involved in LPS biosynthesis